MRGVAAAAGTMRPIGGACAGFKPPYSYRQYSPTVIRPARITGTRVSHAVISHPAIVKRRSVRHYLPMRTHRVVIAGLLVAAGIGIDAVPGYAANDARLTVSPGRGSPDAGFTATYGYPRQKSGSKAGACGAQITFRWDRSSLLGEARSEPDGGRCVATLPTAPPPGSYRGNSTHIVSANSGNGDGGLALAAYTVTPRAAPIPSSAGTTPGAPTPAAATSTTASGAASPAATVSANPAAAPQITDQPEPSAESDVVGPTAVAGDQGTAGKGASFPTGWLLALGTVLLLGGAVVFAAIRRQGRRESLAVEVDPARGIVRLDELLLSPADAVTQQFPAVAATGTEEISPGGRDPQPATQAQPAVQPEPATQAQPTAQSEPTTQAQPRPQAAPPTQRKPQGAPLAQRNPQVG